MNETITTIVVTALFVLVLVHLYGVRTERMGAGGDSRAPGTREQRRTRWHHLLLGKLVGRSEPHAPPIPARLRPAHVVAERLADSQTQSVHQPTAQRHQATGALAPASPHPLGRPLNPPRPTQTLHRPDPLPANSRAGDNLSDAQAHVEPDSSALAAQLWCSSRDGSFDAQVIDLPVGRTRITLGDASTEVPLPGVSAELVLERNGSRWTASVDTPDVAYLGAVPLRDVPLPVPGGVPLTIGGAQLTVAYQRDDRRWGTGSHTTGAGVAAVLDPSSPGLRDLAASTLGMSFDPWEPRGGLSGISRAQAALRALGMPLPPALAVAGIRDDGWVEIVAIGRIRVWAWDRESGTRLLAEANPEVATQVLVTKPLGDLLGIALGDASQDQVEEQLAAMARARTAPSEPTRTSAVEGGALLLLDFGNL